MGKAVFPEKPAVRPLTGTDYVLAQDFYFPATVAGWKVVVHVMPGFRTDGAPTTPCTAAGSCRARPPTTPSGT